MAGMIKLTVQPRVAIVMPSKTAAAQEAGRAFPGTLAIGLRRAR